MLGHCLSLHAASARPFETGFLLAGQGPERRPKQDRPAFSHGGHFCWLVRAFRLRITNTSPMKAILCFRRLIAAAFSLLFAIAAVAADFPTELKLTNGATLHNVSVVRWEKDRVILKHAGGIDPIRYDHIDAAQRAAVLEVRDAATAAAAKAKAENPATPPASPASDVIEGQAFIVTRGAGNYKLGGMIIYAFPSERMGAFQTNLTVELGEPIAKATTDSDGKFKLKLPSTESYFLFARSTRLAGSHQEDYEWIVQSSDITDRTNVLLENSNHRVPTRAVKIGDVTYSARSF
jgi:hypothetical protein